MQIHFYIVWTVVILAILLMFKGLNFKMWSYKCMQCGATNPNKHKEGCSWKGKS